MACNNNPDTDFALYIQLCIKTETLSVYKYVYACSSYAAVLCKFLIQGNKGKGDSSFCDDGIFLCVI